MEIFRMQFVLFAFVSVFNTGLLKTRTLATCSALKKRKPDLPNGHYLIDPDGIGGLPPFRVFCDMRDKKGLGVTVISHDSENRTLVHGCEGKGCFMRSVTYAGASLAQLMRLTRASAFCEQFIKYECHGALLLHGGNSWFHSGGGCRVNYWGGATPGSNKCACGMTKSCASKNLRCNCDENDQKWREDSGFLRYKPDLPVSVLRFGDTGSEKEEGFFTLGKLKCYGLQVCKKSPCLNGGICLGHYRIGKEVRYFCSCADGFTSKHCEKRL